jgi:hypothetical protein
MLEAGPAASRSTGGLRLATLIPSMAKRIGGYIEAVADYYAATTIYEQLNRLSDAELHRRGLSRENLARDGLATHDRAGRSD